MILEQFWWLKKRKEFVFLKKIIFYFVFVIILIFTMPIVFTNKFETKDNEL